MTRCVFFVMPPPQEVDSREEAHSSMMAMVNRNAIHTASLSAVPRLGEHVSFMNHAPGDAMPPTFALYEVTNVNHVLTDAVRPEDAIDVASREIVPPELNALVMIGLRLLDRHGPNLDSLPSGASSD